MPHHRHPSDCADPRDTGTRQGPGQVAGNPGDCPDRGGNRRSGTAWPLVRVLLKTSASRGQSRRTHGDSGAAANPWPTPCSPRHDLRPGTMTGHHEQGRRCFRAASPGCFPAPDAGCRDEPYCEDPADQQETSRRPGMGQSEISHGLWSSRRQPIDDVARAS